MKSKRLLFLTTFALLTAGSHAATVTWTGSPGTTWDEVTANWSGGSPNAGLFVNGDAVTFNLNTAQTISVAADYNLGAFLFDTAADNNYSFSGSKLTLTGGFTNNAGTTFAYTFDNAIGISGTQTWTQIAAGLPASGTAFNRFNGNISGSGNVNLTGYNGALFNAVNNRRAGFSFAPPRAITPAIPAPSPSMAAR